MTKQQVFDLFKIEDLKDLPDAVMRLLEGDITARDAAYCRLLEINNHDTSIDWFQQLYENELSERKEKKQEFTPNSVGVLAALLTGDKSGVIHEPTAGNGSMLIAAWWHRCKNRLPWEHSPADHMVNCWELSNRSIPILLLNLSIRGMMGYVYHGDVLEKSIRAQYVLLNRNNDSLLFSEIIKSTKPNLKIYEI